MARRGLASLALVLWGALIAAPALAGDRALIDVLGYSADGRYFAFEEYGVQDGSGFPYSSLFVIDLNDDTWVGGSPFRARLDSEDASIADARIKARQAAGPALVEFAINRPPQVLALIGDGVPGTDATELRFGAAGYDPGMVIGDYTLSLQTFEAPSGESCADFTDQPILGYALTLSGEGSKRELHRDASVPKSRGCPLAYRLYAVIGRPDTGDISGSVAIVSVYPHGFEGPDRRFIAVPIGTE
jgi:predicted secreted protein